MLRFIGAREDVDKEKYVYENVDGKTLVIVPNQYTLVAEKQALKFLKRACLFDVEIISMNRLGLRILTEKGLEATPLLDKYGRYMLLSKIVRGNKDKFDIFEKTADKRTYIEMVNDFISDFKKQDCSLEELKEMTEDEEIGELLRSKLTELEIILEEYNKEIEGKYTDTEDFISMYSDAIKDSNLIKDKTIWMYGFDSLTKKNIDVLIELAAYSKNVNLILNESDFELEKIMHDAIKAAASKRGIEIGEERIPDSYAIEKSKTILSIEKNLFDRSGEPSGKCDCEGLTLTESANPYYEAESAATYVHSLLRDKGYKMRDILIICNNEETTQPIIKRMFEEYGVPLFVDSRRGVTDTQAVAFLGGQLEFLANKYRTSAMLNFIKSGLTGLDKEVVFELENYVKNYNIKGTMWLSPFKYGSFEYEDELFAKIEGARDFVVSKVLKLEQIAKDAENIETFTGKLKEYLENEWNLREVIDTISKNQEMDDMPEAAELTIQSYNGLMNIVEQINQILSADVVDLKDYLSLFEEGIENIEIGMIPPTIDGITMGTMIRTRTGDAKAVLVLGANEGDLPLEPSPEGLFSVDEKAFFSKKGFSLGKLDDIKMMEENVAMYRTVSKPTECLYVSWSLANENGEEKKPSSLIDALKDLFPEAKIEKDVVSEGFDMKLINNRNEALRHLMNYLKGRPSEMPETSSKNPDELAHAIMTWYEKKEPAMFYSVMKAAKDANTPDDIGKELSKRLFARDGKDFSFSASRLERYHHCPFKHFITYGLRPKEQREFKSGAREIGDMYHECIMRISKRIMADEVDVSLDSEGIELSQESDNRIKVKCAEMVDEELRDISKDYRGGLFVSGEKEEYRLERIKEICEEAAMALVDQLKSGSVKEAFFEERFGRNCRFEPIDFSLNGEKVYIEGKIDRVDITEGNNVRIIDYKTGTETVDIDFMKSGYKMQLMVYMEGVVGGKNNRKPAGVFYFKISDSAVNGNRSKNLEADIEKEDSNKFKLDGIYINEQEIVDSIPDNSRVKKNAKNPGKTALSREAFEEIEEAVHKKIEMISDEIISGKIDISPTVIHENTSRMQTECRYCDYKAICKFDQTYTGNSYRKGNQ